MPSSSSRKVEKPGFSLVGSSNDLGLLYQDLKRLDEAEAGFQQAMQADPHEPLYARNLGYLYFVQKRFADAAGSFRNALALQPGDAENLNGLAWSLYAQGGELREAEQLARLAVATELQANYVHTLTAIVLRRGGWEEAFGPFQQWLSLSDREFLDANHDDVIKLLRECLTLIGPVRLGEVIKNESQHDYWKPWIEAIERLGGSNDPLSEGACAIFTELSAERSPRGAAV